MQTVGNYLGKGMPRGGASQWNSGCGKGETGFGIGVALLVAGQTKVWKKARG